jgi:hypothetical protein
VKRMRIFICKKMDQPVKKTKADREDFTLHSISFSRQHVILAPHMKTNVILSRRRQWTGNLEIQDCSGTYMSVCDCIGLNGCCEVYLMEVVQKHFHTLRKVLSQCDIRYWINGLNLIIFDQVSDVLNRFT